MIRYFLQLSARPKEVEERGKRSRSSVLVLAASVVALTLLGAHASAQLAMPEKESLAAPRAPVPDDVVSQTAGLRVTPTFVGRSEDGKQLTISALIENVADKAVGLALIPPWPQAVDNAGAFYQSAGFAGTGVCESRKTTYCLENYSGWLPKQAFAILTPGGRITAVFTFKVEGGPARPRWQGKCRQLLVDVRHETGDDAWKRTRVEGDRGLRTVTISFPNI